MTTLHERHSEAPHIYAAGLGRSMAEIPASVRDGSPLEYFATCSGAAEETFRLKWPEMPETQIGELLNWFRLGFAGRQRELFN